MKWTAYFKVREKKPKLVIRSTKLPRLIALPRLIKKIRGETEITNIKNARVVIIAEPTNIKGIKKYYEQVDTFKFGT